MTQTAALTETVDFVPQDTGPARRTVDWRRLVTGGLLTDRGRLPRYVGLAMLGGAMIWVPITGYISTAPLKYNSSLSLILPGSGVSASVNLAEIGQASSFANSAFATNAVSPTETYKRLIGADRILSAAASALGLQVKALGRPRIDLIDQTGLIRVEMTGPSPEGARARTEALLAAFMSEIDALRQDEMQVRERGGLGAIEDYRASVEATRATIANLRDETGLVSFAQYERLVASKDALSAEVKALGSTVAERSEAVAALSRALGVTPEDAAVTLKLYADAEYNALLEEIARHTAALTQANSLYGPRHLEVTSARNALSAAQSAASELASRITGLRHNELAALDLGAPGARADLLTELVRGEASRRGAETEYRTMAARLEDETTRLAALGADAARLEDMQRDFNVAEAVFASAIARSQSSKADVYASYPLVQVLENPSLPDRPSSPNTKLAIAAGIAATLMMLTGLSLGWFRQALLGRLLTKPCERGA